MNTRNGTSRKKISRTAKFEVCIALEYNIWWQFEYRKWQEDLYGKKLLDSKACYPATFSHINPVSISKISISTKFYASMLQTSNLAILLFFSALSISAIHKVPGISCKRSIHIGCMRSLTYLKWELHKSHHSFLPCTAPVFGCGTGYSFGNLPNLSQVFMSQTCLFTLSLGKF